MAEIGAHSASGAFGRMIPVRLRTGTDVSEGLRQVCQEHGVRYGAVLVGIGSLRQLTYQVLAPKADTKLGAGYTDPQCLPGPIEIVSLQGVIFESEHGEMLLHLHGTFSDRGGKVFGGHVVPGGNPVLATLDAVVAEVAGARLIRRPDPDVGLGLFTPEKE
ncbi:MAG TPA: PPC domain-containing DNA-binding protein [Candidatus Methylomirabilis sp.]|nr:PPC domain-containing DNA-binding protein [Candidatus Methylomirabilis sp.]